MLKRSSVAQADNFAAIPAPGLSAEPSVPKVDAVTAAAGEVWRELGAGHYEEVYRSAMAIALHRYKPREEVSVPVYFRGYCVGAGRADIVILDITGDVVLELKTVARLTDAHRSQLRAYMRSLKKTRGALINFPPAGDDVETEGVFL